MFLSNKTEMIYKFFYIVNNSNKHTSQFFAYFQFILKSILQVWLFLPWEVESE